MDHGRSCLEIRCADRHSFHLLIPAMHVESSANKIFEGKIDKKGYEGYRSTITPNLLSE